MSETEPCEYDYLTGMPVHSPITRSPVTVNNGSAPSNTKIDAPTNVDNSTNKPLPYIVGLAVLATAGCAFGILAKMDADRCERETRMLEYYLLELDAKVIAAGIKPPEEAISLKLNKDKS